MNPREIFCEVDKLSLSEKIILLEDIWDSIALSNDQLPLPEWQKTELIRRYKDYQNGKMETHAWQKIHSRLRDHRR